MDYYDIESLFESRYAGVIGDKGFEISSLK